MLRIVALFLLSSLLVLSASCRTQFQPQSIEVTDPGPPERVLPTIRVLDAGMTPRQPLRYRVTPGQTELLYLEVARAQAARAGGQGAEGGMPPVQIEVKMGPASMSRQGFIHHPVAITQVRLSEVAERMSPAQREQLEESLAPLLQVKGWSEMDVQGRIRRGEFEGMESVSPELTAMLGNIRSALLTVPFPDEPLGARARWEVERKFQFSGIWIDQVVTYHIKRIRGEEIDLQITARQTANPQQIANGRLEAYQASILGSAAVRLTHFAAFSEAESTTQMRISQPAPMGESQLVSVDTRTIVRLYPADEGERPSAPEEEPADPEDAKVITDPGKQKLKWYTP
jgi:hypothetical protein